MVRYVLRGRTLTMSIPPVSAPTTAVVATLRLIDTRPTLAKAMTSIRSSGWRWGVATATTCCTFLFLIGALSQCGIFTGRRRQDWAPPRNACGDADRHRAVSSAGRQIDPLAGY